MIILAAGRGTRLRPLTDTQPKCLVQLGGRSLLDWQLDAGHTAGVDDVTVVGGYLVDQLQGRAFPVIRNPDYEATNMVSTLFCAEEMFGQEFVLSYGDIVYGPEVLRTLLADASEVGVVVDREWRPYWETRFDDPMRDAESLRIGPEGQITSIGQQETAIDRIEAQYIGLMAFRGPGVEALRHSYSVAKAQEERGQLPFGGGRPLAKLHMTDLLQGMIDLGHLVEAVPIRGQWMEIDSVGDLELAERLLAKGRLEPTHVIAGE